MQNLLPHFILKKHAAGERQGRFSAASLFVDISGFSAVTNTLMEHGSEAAEAMADVMCGVFEPLVDAVYAQGGFITTFAGDAFTVLFPTGDGQPDQQALAAAVAVQQHMIAHPVHETPYGKFPFKIKLGLGDGEVVWGILASEQAEGQAAYYFGGQAVEAAAEAEHYAQPGNLVLSPSVGKSLGDRIKTFPVGDAGHTRLLAVEGELPAPLPLAEPEPLPGQAAFVPPAVLERPSQGEFRQVVSVFVNLMSSGLMPAGLMGIEGGENLATFMDAVFDLCRQYGGYLARVDFGDKGCNLLLFWGMPTSTENDIACALGFIHDLGDYTPGTYKAGLTYRPMYAGLAGSDRRGEYTAYGGGVSYAARLMMAAPWGGIWLDERVAKRAGGRYVIEKEGEHTFKGFDEPQPVYALLERQTLDINGYYQGELVGREAELAQLEAFVQPLLAAEGEKCFAGILTVIGEAGLGKTRLVHEFLARPSQFPNFQTFLCQTDQTVRQPLNPFCYWLRNYFGQSPTQSETRNKRAFGRRLDQLVTVVPDNTPQSEALQQELNQGRSFLGALIGLHWPNSPYTQLDPQGRHEWTVTALKSLILAESLRQPVVLNLEDAHWLDAESVDFVQRLVRQVDDYPLAILATARPTIGDKPLFGQAAYHKIDLAVMNDADLVQLASNLLEGAIGDDLAALLAERAEGNPFFVEQILLYLQEEDGIEQVDGTWQLAGGRAQASPLPADVRTIFTARLDRLTGKVRDVVQTAAILGREFEVRVLAQMLRDDETLPDKVRSAEEQAIWTALSQVRYLFKHGLLRDAAYEMQLRARRRELHKLAAEALERLYADDPSTDSGQGLAPHYGEIAYHYEAACRQGLAEVHQQAIIYLRQAGEQAASDYENAAAVDYYRRALVLTPEEDAGGRFELLLGREAVYDLQGNREAQAQDLDALQALAQTRQRPGEQAEIALRWAKYANAISDYPQAIEQARAAIATAQAAGDVGQETVGQLEWVAALWRQGEYAAAGEHLVQALALAGAAGRRDLEADSLLNLGIAAWLQGDYARAQGYTEQSLAMYRKIGARLGESKALASLGVVARQQGDYARARSYIEQSLAICREIGARLGESEALVGLGVAASDLGDYAGAQGYCERSLAIFYEIGDRWCGGIALCSLGAVTGSQGDYAGARGYYERALAICRETGDREGEGYALTGLGDVLVGLGNTAEAIDLLHKVISLRRELDNIVLLMESLATLARAHLAQEDTTQALTVVEDILSFLGSPYLDKGGHPSTGSGHGFDGTEQPLRNDLTCYQVLQAADDPRAAGVLQAAYDALQEQAARIPDDESRRSFLENVPWHRDIQAAYRDKGVEPAPVEAGGAALPAPSAPETAVVAEAKAAVAAPELPVVTGAAEPIEPAVIQPAAAEPPPAQVAAVQPEAEPVVTETAAPPPTVEKTPVKPATTAAAEQVAEAIAAAAGVPGSVLIINIDTLNIDTLNIPGPGTPVGKDRAGTPQKKAKRGKKRKKRRASGKKKKR